MYKIGNSKAPLFHQLEKMADNLCEKLNKTAYIRVEAVSYNHCKKRDRVRHGFQISLVPGFNEKCSAWYPDAWKETFEIYTKLMKGEITSGK